MYFYRRTFYGVINNRKNLKFLPKFYSKMNFESIKPINSVSVAEKQAEKSDFVGGSDTGNE